MIESDKWKYIIEKIPDPKYHALRYTIKTPEKTLSMTLQSSPQTTWVSERLIKEKKDIQIFEKYAPSPVCDVSIINEKAQEFEDQVCIIGGFDQFHYFKDCTPQETRKEVRRCFEEAGEGGGFILSPSDHFFDAELRLIKAFTDEAKECTY